MEIESVMIPARTGFPASKEDDRSRGRWNQTFLRLIGLKAPSHNPVLGTQPAGLPACGSLQSTENSAKGEQIRAIKNADLVSGRAAAESPTSTVTGSVFSSIDASADRSALSTISESLSVDSLVLDTYVYEVQKGVFIAPKIGLSAEHLENWSSIRSRLEDTLRHLFKPVKGLDPTVSLEFMLTGPSKTQLQPSIIIVCCSSSYMRQLRKILKSQKWIGEYGYRCVVLVDPLKKLSGPVHEPTGLRRSHTDEETVMTSKGSQEGILTSRSLAAISVIVVALYIVIFITFLQARVAQNGVVETSDNIGQNEKSTSVATILGIAAAGFLTTLLALLVGVLVYRRRRFLRNYGHDYTKLRPWTSRSEANDTSIDDWEETGTRNIRSTSRAITPKAVPDVSIEMGVIVDRNTSGTSIITNPPVVAGSRSQTEPDSEAEMAAEILGDMEQEAVYQVRQQRREHAENPRARRRVSEGRSNSSQEGERLDFLGSFADGIDLGVRSYLPARPLSVTPASHTLGLETTARIHIFAQLQSWKPSICGVLAEATVSPEKKASFTIGGVILVDSQRYGLTTRHSFEDNGKWCSRESDGELSESSIFADTEDEDISPYISFDEMSEDSVDDHYDHSNLTVSPVLSSYNCHRPIETFEENSQEISSLIIPVNSPNKHDVLTGYQHIGVLSKLGLQHTKGLVCQDKPPLDWALLQLDDTIGLSSNAMPPILENSSSTIVSSIIKTDLIEDSQVLVLGGASGLVTGWLRGCPVSLNFNGSSFEARQIVLDMPLGKHRRLKSFVKHG